MCLNTEYCSDTPPCNLALWAVSALQPLPVDELQRVVGADYWEPNRFERALAFAIADGLVLRNAEGNLQAAP